MTPPRAPARAGPPLLVAVLALGGALLFPRAGRGRGSSVKIYGFPDFSPIVSD